MKYPILILLVVIVAVGGAYSQVPDDDNDIVSTLPGMKRKEEPPKGLKETLIKMRIEKDKKDFNAMLKRGDDVVRLAQELDDNGALVQQEKITNIGKLVKKIREELGGDGDGDDDGRSIPSTSFEAVKALKEQINALSDELKRASRFTVSAAAIGRTNDILRLVKYLRG